MTERVGGRKGNKIVVLMRGEREKDRQTDRQTDR